MGRLIGLCLVLVVASACAGQDVADTATTGDTSAAPEPASATVTPETTETADEPALGDPSELPGADVETLRVLALAYWEAFNAYEADTVLGYLAEDYRSQREEEIRSDIGRLSQFGVQLGVTEETPPVSISNDEAEMFVTLKEPLGTRTIRMAFIRAGGEWKISFAEEVDD